jgi:hypothetical protein
MVVFASGSVRAAEPPLGTKNFSAPSYAPDYFSNESGPFHTVPRASFYAAPRYTPQPYSAPRYAAPAAFRYAASAAPRHPILPHYARPATASRVAYPDYYRRASYPAPDRRLRAHREEARHHHRRIRKEPVRYAADREPRRSYHRSTHAERLWASHAHRVAIDERRAREHSRSPGSHRQLSGHHGGRAVRGRL